MTRRKPPNVTIPGWIERQIRVAEDQGAFENLPGAGKPIPGLGEPQHEMAWIANYLKRENADVTALLPPAFALAKEVDELPQRLLAERTEAKARAVVEDLNDRIRTAHRIPSDGPPIRVWIVDVELALQRWRAEVEVEPTPVVEPPAAPEPRRRWFTRRPA